MIPLLESLLLIKLVRCFRFRSESSVRGFRTCLIDITVLSEILAARVCGGSKFAKKNIIRKMLDLLINPHVWSQSLL